MNSKIFKDRYNLEPKKFVIDKDKNKFNKTRYLLPMYISTDRSYEGYQSEEKIKDKKIQRIYAKIMNSLNFIDMIKLEKS